MSFDVRFYWSLFLRRLPVMLALLLVCSGVSLVSALKLPAVYSASARLLVEEAQIDLAPRESQDSGAEKLQVIEQQLMTRANLIDTARNLDVFENVDAMTPDSVVAAMTKATTIRRQSGRDQATLMTISFTGRSPRVVADVVNAYVTLILDASSKARLSRAEGTLAFFEQEVQRLSEDLDQQSARIVAFKNANASALPDDLEYRMNRQSLLQERLARLESDRAALVAQRNDVVTVFQATGQIRPEAEAPLTPDQQELAILKRELDQARAIFAETNPKVTMLKTRVAQLEASIAASVVPAAPESPEPASLLDVTLAQIDARIATLDTEIAAANAELQALEASIAATSANAITLGALERDYVNIQERYNAAVNNLNAARMSERIETTAKGERVTVIENASVPQVPSGPNRRKIAATGIALGLGLAAGWFVLLEVLNRTIRQPSELKGRFGILPIATLPYIESRRDKLRRRGILVAASLAVLIGVPAVLWYTDTYYMPLETLAAKVMVRLGVS